MPVPHATEMPERTDHRPASHPSDAAPRAPSRTRPPRPSGRRRLAAALVVAGAVHLLLLLVVRLPVPQPAPPAGEVDVAFEPLTPARPEAAEVAPEAPAGPPGESTTEPPRRAPPAARSPETPIARPRPSERAPRVRTIPPTTLLAPLAPLEATPGGVGRRTVPPDTRRMAIQRAESLLMSRLAGLPGAGVPREPSVGLAEGGGVTVPIPWGGFIPEDRKDRVWREERCAGKDADQADKPGEAEARNAQCD